MKSLYHKKDEEVSNVTYEKKVMRLSELEGYGFPKEYLMRAYRARGQTFAQKINPAARNSPIIFDTEEFDKWRLKNI